MNVVLCMCYNNHRQVMLVVEVVGDILLGKAYNRRVVGICCFCS